MTIGIHPKTHVYLATVYLWCWRILNVSLTTRYWDYKLPTTTCFISLHETQLVALRTWDSAGSPENIDTISTKDLDGLDHSDADWNHSGGEDGADMHAARSPHNCTVQQEFFCAEVGGHVQPIGSPCSPRMYYAWRTWRMRESNWDRSGTRSQLLLLYWPRMSEL